MADTLELVEKLTANLYDLDKLFELANETWPEMLALMKSKVQMDPSFVEQMWGVLSPNWELIIEDIDQDLDTFYEELQEAAVGVDITDWNTMWRIFSEQRPELADQIRLLGFEQCNDNVEGFKEEHAWGMLCEMWRVVATCVTEELKKREVVGKVELKEVLKILAEKLPELMSVGQRELGNTKSVWRVWMKEIGSMDDGDILELSDGEKEEETESKKNEVKEENEGSEAGDASPRTSN